jgi:small subunit ribosomal protein S10
MAKQKMRLTLRAFDHRLLDESVTKICATVRNSGTKYSGPIPMPTEIRKYTVLRSPFVNKDAREQFEMRIHKRNLDLLSPSGQTVDSLMNMDLPSGVNIEIKML